MARNAEPLLTVLIKATASSIRAEIPLRCRVPMVVWKMIVDFQEPKTISKSIGLCRGRLPMKSLPLIAVPVLPEIHFPVAAAGTQTMYGILGLRGPEAPCLARGR